MSAPEILHFKTNVQLKSIIGKDLINDDNIAILELVKNSFDADAKKVVVSYHNLKDNDDETADHVTDQSSKLIIQDDGQGMDLDDITNKWLNIAYSDKKSNKTRHNRRMAGAKGVGRFSCDRLGEFLFLYAKKKDAEEYLKLNIDWKKFEVEDEKKEIQTIPLEIERLTKEELSALDIEPFDQGVLLEIRKLRSSWVYQRKNSDGGISWNTDKFHELKKYLEKLINPSQAFISDDFGIYMNAPEFIEENSLRSINEQFIGRIENRIFDRLDFKSTNIEVETIDDGVNMSTELKDKGETIFRIKEKNPFYPHLKQIKITLYFLNTYAKSFFTKQTGIRSVDYGSVFLFINGFRIPPYGEVGNDWLGLDQRKGQGTKRFLGLREVVGQIEILDEFNDFQIISSREGVVRNENFLKLTNQDKNNSLFFKSFRRLERYVVDGLDWDSSPYSFKDPALREIESKIISGETTEDDLVYREDQTTKNRRIYTVIHNIISAKPDDVIELYINEALIHSKIEEEKLQSEQEFEVLLDEFENRKIDIETLSRVLERKAVVNSDLDKQLKEFSKYSINEATSKAILEIQNYKNAVEEQTALIEKLKEELEEAKKRAEEEEKQREETRKELTETREQNLFLKSIRSRDFEDMLNLMHHIGISTSTIQHYIKGAIFKIDNDIEIDKGELKQIFSKLNYELNKIHSVSKFATKANFKVETKDSSLDIVGFIEQYLINVIKPYLASDINFTFYDHDIKEFKTLFKPIELIIVLDNLISNSKKAFKNLSGIEKKIEVSFRQLSDEVIQFIFKDNGVGVENSVRSKIFDLGFTTTDGSGLGLAHVKEIIEGMGSKIELGESENGAEFIITIIKR